MRHPSRQDIAGDDTVTGFEIRDEHLMPGGHLGNQNAGSILVANARPVSNAALVVRAVQLSNWKRLMQTANQRGG